jgi:hypothetical protein
MREKNRSDKKEPEDFAAVERHLKEGRERSKRISPGPPVAETKSIF